MTAPITWSEHIQPMLAFAVIPDMTNIGYDLSDYDFVAANYRVLHSRMADGSMPPGVSEERIEYLRKWIDNEAPAADFPEVVDILDRAIGGKASISAHGTFWRSPTTRDDFIKYSYLGEDLIVQWDGAKSNLIKALKGEAPFDGSSYNRMPDGFWWTTEDRKKNVALFEQWKTDGFMKDPPAPPTNVVFSDVVTILDTAVGGASATVGAHGPFWRDVDRDTFVKMSIYGVQLISEKDGAGSNLVKALRGDKPFDGSTYQRMPAGKPPVSDPDIQKIVSWIKDGAPE